MDDTQALIPAEVLRLTIGAYALNPLGTHGLGHWARVLENGLLLAEETQADRVVVSLFAVLHDCRRVNEGTDRGHGLRSSQLATELLALVPALTEVGAEQLRFACAHHTDGGVHDDPTIATCWDSDRLDLGRVGIRPRADLLSTGAARNPDVIREATARAMSGVIPPLVQEDWLRYAGGGEAGDPK